MKWATLRTFLAGIFPPASGRIVESMEESMLLESVAQALKEMDASLKAFVEVALEFLQSGKADEAGRMLEKALEQMGGSAPIEEAPAPEMSTDAGPSVYEAKAVTDAQAILAEAQRVATETQNTAAEISRDRRNDLLERRLKESALPDVAAEKIRKQLKDQTFTEAVLEGEIKYAKDILAVNAGGMALIEGQGQRSASGPYGHIQILCEGVDKLQIGSNLLFGYPWQKDESLTESEKETYKSLARNPRNYSPASLYHAATNDWEHDNQLRPGCLLEAATTANFPNILSTSMNKTLHFVFTTAETAAWEPFIKQVDLLNLKQNDRHIAGGFTTLPGVNEAGTYQDLGVPLELPTNYTLGKKGGLFIFTEEMIFNDDLHYFQSIIPALKKAGFDTRDRLAYNLLIGAMTNGTINQDTSYDNLFHYHGAHDNLGGATLSYASLMVAVQSLMRTRAIAFKTNVTINHADNVLTLTVASTSGLQAGNYARLGGEIVRITSINSSTTATIVRAQLGTAAAAATNGDTVIVLGGSLGLGALNLHLVVPVGLWGVAKTLVESDLVPGGNNNDKNILKGLLTVLPVDEQYLGGDMNNWYVTTTHENVPGLEMGYLNGERAPIVIVQDQPAVGQVFTNDQMTYKVKYRIGGKGIMHEGRYAGLPA